MSKVKVDGVLMNKVELNKECLEQTFELSRIFGYDYTKVSQLEESFTKKRNNITRQSI